jgi:hypothetical protein
MAGFYMVWPFPLDVGTCRILRSRSTRLVEASVFHRSVPMPSYAQLSPVGILLLRRSDRLSTIFCSSITPIIVPGTGEVNPPELAVDVSVSPIDTLGPRSEPGRCGIA